MREPAAGRPGARRGAYDSGIELTDENAAALYRAAFESSPDGLIVVDGDGVVRAASPAFAAMFGTTVDDVVGTEVEEYVPTASRGPHRAHRRDYAADPTRRPMGTGLRLLGRHVDGGTFPVEVGLSPVSGTDGDLTIAAVRDVTERQAARSTLALAEERERIARDIHDMVIQRVFAAGMALQAVVPLATSPVVRDRLTSVTDDLDDTIRELRGAIFRLDSFDGERSLMTQVRAVVDERSQFLGFTPHLHVDGSLDDVPDYVAEQFVATLTEGLSNVARHANATDVTIEVRRLEGEFHLTVTDDGVGIRDTPKPRGGLSNLMWRAAELGGSCAVEPNRPTGTRLTWTVPA